MLCDDAKIFLDEMLDNKPGKAPEQVFLHFKQCRACSKQLEQWEKLRQSLNLSFPPIPPMGLEEIVIASIAGTQATTASPGHRFKTIKRNLKLRFLAVAATLAIAVTSGLIIYKRLPSTDNRPTVFAANKNNHPMDSLKPQQQHKNTASNIRAVNFHLSLSLPHAENVSVVGDFNNWDKSKNALKQSQEGIWKISLYLPSGYFQYQILVDGKKWLLDPNNPNKVDDGFGGFNSAIVL